MKQDGPVIGIKNLPRFLICRCMGRTAVTVIVTGTAELTFPSYPWRCDHTGRVNDFYVGCSILKGMVTILLQILFFHVQSPLSCLSFQHGCVDKFNFLQQFLSVDDSLSIQQIDKGFKLNDFGQECVSQGDDFFRGKVLSHLSEAR
jgi:hypothetical protein